MAKPSAPTATITPGVHPLDLVPERDSLIYVPPTVDPARPAPLLVLLHGSGGSAAWWGPDRLAALADPAGIVVVAPSSSTPTWDLRLDGYGPDVEIVDASMKFAFAHCAIDPQRIALGGYSDGGSYALSLGLENGDLFCCLLAFSPGICSTDDLVGKPKIYITHGTQDSVLPITQTSRLIVPLLRGLGYKVTYKEFDGGHVVEPALAAAGMRWFAGSWRAHIYRYISIYDPGTAMTDATLMRALKALAHATRFRMVQEIAAAGELSCGRLGERFPLSQPTISHHLKLLTDAGVIVARRDGQHAILSVDREVIDGLLGSLPERLVPVLRRPRGAARRPPKARGGRRRG
jgi:phospholipase/carboxylesterase